MDPLSITAGVIAILGLTEKIISSCKSYLSSIRDAPSDLRSILIEVSSLKSILDNLQFLASHGADGDHSQALQDLSGPDGPIHGCWEALAKLEKLFPSTTVQGSMATKRRATNISLAQLAWPFKKRHAAEFMDQIHRHKSTISLSLTSDTAYNVGRINSRLTHLCEALDRESQYKMLKWLVTTDPSPDHNTACSRHDAHTGNWLSKSPEYQSWTTFKTRFLWLYGIPGAGKTVLLSSIIENVKSLCKTSPSKDVACVYYYCYFGRNQDETAPLLRWIIDQLIRCCQHVPNEILDCFRAGQQPSVSTLAVALASLVKKFQRIYLFVDALDESLERQNVLDLLLTLAGPGFDNISLLVMSREESDIKIAIGSTAESISLSNPYVDDDIRTYIRNQLKLHRKLSVLEPALRIEIEDGLVQGAKGMFRWAACQIDVLGRLHNASDIRKALSELPETLEDVYERILLSIHLKYRGIAQKALALLAFHSYEFDKNNGAVSLAEAAIVDVEQLKFDPKDRLLSPGDLFEICSCLITKSGENGAKLAHYTVKEFLVSERIKKTRATEFQTSEDTANSLMCKIILLYLLETRCDGVAQAADYFKWSADEKDRFLDCVVEGSPFMYDAYGWDGLSRKIKNVMDRAIIDGLVLRLLDPKGLHYNNWLEWEDIRTDGINRYFPRWETRDGFEGNIAFAYAVHFEQPRTTMELIISQYPGLPNSSIRLELEKKNRILLPDNYECWLHGTPLEMAIIHRYESAIQLLLEKGADPNKFSFNFHLSPLCTALDDYWDENGVKRQGTCDGSVRLLIAAGADLNPRRTAQTPLQLAAKWAGYDVVEFLLDKGADVNAIGNDDAVMADIKRSWVERGENNEDELKELLRERGTGIEYLTPLRIASKRYIGDDGEKSRIDDLLRRRGGKSLCLFPAKDLPGYVEEDIEVMSTLTSQSDLLPNHPATGAPKLDSGVGDAKPSEFSSYFDEFLASDFGDFAFYKQGVGTLCAE